MLFAETAVTAKATGKTADEPAESVDPEHISVSMELERKISGRMSTKLTELKVGVSIHGRRGKEMEEKLQSTMLPALQLQE